MTKVLTVYFGSKPIVVRNHQAVEALLAKVDLSKLKFEAKEVKPSQEAFKWVLRNGKTA